MKSTAAQIAAILDRKRDFLALYDDESDIKIRSIRGWIVRPDDTMTPAPFVGF